MDFPVASQYVTFSLPFELPVGGHPRELRVYWLGGAYVKADSTAVADGPDTDQMTLFASLKGLVNFSRPRIFTFEGDAYAEGATTWLTSLGLGWTELVVYDPAVPDTINLATSIAPPPRTTTWSRVPPDTAIRTRIHGRTPPRRTSSSRSRTTATSARACGC